MSAIFIPSGHGAFDLSQGSGGSSTLHIEASWCGRAFTRIATVTSALAGFSLLAPVNYQTFQRSTTVLGAITISGTLNGVAWSGVLTDVPSQGSLIVRVEEDHTLTATRLSVGIGELLATSGQSNMAGRFTNPQPYSSVDGFLLTKYFGTYAPANVWYQWLDGGVGDDGNTFLPKLATLISNTYHVPVGIVVGPCQGGTTWANWQPGGDHQDTATLYGNLNYRVHQCGSIPRVNLNWLGESDAANGSAASTIEPLMDAFVDALYSDTGGMRSMLCTLQVCPAVASDAQTQQIRNAASEVMGDNPHAVRGPSFVNLPVDDAAYHYTTDASATTVAQRWFSAWVAAFFPTPTIMTPASVGQPALATYRDLVMV